MNPNLDPNVSPCSKLKVWWRRIVASRIMNDNGNLRVLTRWERDYTLSSTDKLDLLDEYLEMGETLDIIHYAVTPTRVR